MILTFLNFKIQENDIFTFINAGVLVRKSVSSTGEIIRYIDQICFFDRVGEENIITLLYDSGKFVEKNLSENIIKKFHLYGVTDPFSDPTEN